MHAAHACKFHHRHSPLLVILHPRTVSFKPLEAHCMTLTSSSHDPLQGFNVAESCNLFLEVCGWTLEKLWLVGGWVGWVVAVGVSLTVLWEGARWCRARDRAGCQRSCGWWVAGWQLLMRLSPAAPSHPPRVLNTHAHR